MEQRVLIMRGQSTVVDSLLDSLGESRTRYTERIRFVERQLDDIHNQCNDERRKIWDDIHDALKASGKLPQEYDPKTYSLVTDSRGAAVYLLDPTACNHTKTFIVG